MPVIKSSRAKALLASTGIMSTCALLFSQGASSASTVYMSPEAEKTEHDSGVFREDPQYPNYKYDVEAQLKIYGDKRENTNPRALLELGRRIYDTGLFSKPSYIFGKKNPVEHQFLIYGDFRMAAGSNDNGVDEDSEDLIAFKTTIDMDWKITATERIHAIFTPLDSDDGITRFDFGEDLEGETIGFESETDFTPDALFLEGDLAAIVSGITDSYPTWDMPFAIGLMPLFLQNGVWMNDAFTGVAATLPAQNSRLFNISNYDITFFAGFDEINSGLDLEIDETDMVGITGFFEMWEGYLELGYGFVMDQSELGDQDYHNLGLSFTRRYGGRLSNSVRLVGNFGQDREDEAPLTADGVAIFVENSLITSLPSTLVPYFNFFYVADTVVPIAKAGAAGGLLSNVGILFESDGVTGQQILQANGSDSFGAALGIEYLFDLTQQVVVEVAANIANDEEESLLVDGDQFGLGFRYQKALNRRWLLRSDISYLTFDDEAIEDRTSARLELRAKF